MKKLLIVICGLFLLTFTSGCTRKDTNTKVLYVYNWEEYIDEDLIEEFENDYFENNGEKVKVVYNTFQTNETMYNNFKTGKQHYDLICPSDYLIQKMMLNGELLPFDLEADGSYTYMTNFNEYGSPYIKDLFENKTYEIEGEEHSWNQYALPYMWGTVGLIYNVDAFEDEDFIDDMNSWLSLWDSKYKNTFTIKNSVRDTYFVALINVYEEELQLLADNYDTGLISAEDYNQEVTKILNRCDNDTIAEVEDVLKALKKNSFGLEVDSGKNDIVNGKIAINIAWSGDAVYAIQLASEVDVTLNYVIPQLGSNIWFDGWVMPKGANSELAQQFLNFLCTPDAAMRNMEEIGYTSAIAGQEVFNLMTEWYGSDEVDDTIDYDLSYFFDGTLDDNVEPYITVLADDVGFISAQYVDSETIVRCTIMEDFGTQNLEIMAMWSRVKVMEVPDWLYILAGVITIAFISGLVTYRVRKDIIRKKRKKIKLKAA